MQTILGRILNAACTDVDHTDVHDKGLFYYRLLTSAAAGSSGIEACSEIVAPKKGSVLKFNDDIVVELNV